MPTLRALAIARDLRTRIEAGEWADNRVPAERDLAVEFKAARNTVRRAMALLEREGALAREVGRGTFVRRNGSGVGQAIARLEGASPADIMDVRLMLEPGAAATAVINASAADLAHVEAAHAQALAARAMPAFERWDAAFHQRIVACVRNDLLEALYALLQGLRDRTPWLELKRRSFSEERRQRYCEEHAAILAALQRRDAGAVEAAVRGHLTTVRLNLLGR